jgi:hypothetical protein|nr:hypothetical protein [uncultured Flavobacterium sp.]
MKKNILFLTIATSLLFNANSFAQRKVAKTTNPKVSALSTIELLQGKWQSLDDKTNFVIFDKNQRKEIAEGMKTWNSEPFTLSNKCLNESDTEMVGKPEKDKYISCNKSDMCWYIITINKKKLTLSYTLRGNTLEYKRVE